MTRAIFPGNEQSVWLNKIAEKSKLSNNELAEICRVSSKTFRDWRRGKYTISEKALLKLSGTFRESIPVTVKNVDDFWYVSKGAKKGALRRLELYGPLGTIGSRKKGGRISQQHRREDPEKYRALGCIVRKRFSQLGKSEALAEVVGIILGDGAVTNYQVRITLDRKIDMEYALLIQNLMNKVFGELPTYKERKEDNTISLTISGIGLVENLSKIGVGKGDKIKRQIDFPKWIWGRPEYQIACVRGLFDTDGGIYFHNHWTKGIKYRNLGLCFTSWSKPLLRSVSKVLSKFKIKHSVREAGYIYVYDLNEIRKYFKIFQPHNSKFYKKLEYHESHPRVLERKLGEVA